MAVFSKEVIAVKVKNGRLQKGLTQQELAALTNISLRSIQRIENGEVLPRLYSLTILAKQLGFSLDEVTEKAVPASPAKSSGLGKTQKIILSTGSCLLLILLAGAFVSQSAKSNKHAKYPYRFSLFLQ